jgi:hypothetical protein
VTITPDMLEGAPQFDPAPRGSSRYDGWTPARQRAFVKALAETGCVRRAARWVGMSEVGAYQLRKAPGAEGFARAWEEALTLGVERLADIAYDRAVHGVAVPIFYKGEQVGERRWYNDRLLTWVLRHRDPAHYGGPAGNRVPPHIRRALREEWELERAEKEAIEADQARAELHEKLREMAERLGIRRGEAPEEE